MAAEGQAGLDRADRVVVPPIGDLHAGLDRQQATPLPHGLGVRKEDLDHVESLLGEGVVPVARLAAGAECEQLELAAPEVDEPTGLGGRQLIERHRPPLLRILADLLPVGFQ
jgi:hypothetical protein